MQYKMGGNPCGLVLCLGSLEKTDRFRLGGTVPVWLFAERGWMFCGGNDYFWGITRISAITLTVAGVSVNSDVVLTFREKIKVDPFNNLYSAEQNSEVAQCN